MKLYDRVGKTIIWLVMIKRKHWSLRLARIS